MLKKFSKKTSQIRLKNKKNSHTLIQKQTDIGKTRIKNNHERHNNDQEQIPRSAS